MNGRVACVHKGSYAIPLRMYSLLVQGGKLTNLACEWLINSALKVVCISFELLMFFFNNKYQFMLEIFIITCFVRAHGTVHCSTSINRHHFDFVGL